MADKAEKAVLVIITHTKDSDGYPVDVETRREVFVTEKSVLRTEFYEAMKAGVQVKTVLELRQEDFDKKATKIIYDHETYTIQRSYRAPDDKSKIELILI